MGVVFVVANDIIIVDDVVVVEGVVATEDVVWRSHIICFLISTSKRFFSCLSISSLEAASLELAELELEVETGESGRPVA